MGMSERRPKASATPIGSEAMMPTKAMIKVTNNPPHLWVSTTSSPKTPP
ncbi:Uncharacterised protein [Vibrio cholerae]|nr:Uncharacterised protein [Vibrio cholerae]CSB75714.1 Uncharacterised protein [Vibrio cholerae]CSC15910.1 Uncharacterised protein [Vibrio cholerae]CSD00922.1 Uncharacterised protein [Vibrio cholerae]CSD08183.1 Uncharacterised protein [Vibrio cholerae]